MTQFQLDEKIRRNKEKIAQLENVQKKNYWIEFWIEMGAFIVLFTITVILFVDLSIKNTNNSIYGLAAGGVGMLMYLEIPLLVLAIVRIIINQNRKKRAPANIDKLTREIEDFKIAFEKSNKDDSYKEEIKDKSKEIVDYDLLVKYKELLDSGVITQEEFEKKKKDILGME